MPGYRTTVKDGRNIFYRLTLFRGFMLLPLPIRETIYEHAVDHAGFLSLVATNEVSITPLENSLPKVNPVSKYDGIPTIWNKL
ncbi:predicted protein [Botrytis cinerea T4]|uniref:Uncharacterized protein n=1 Tax=Botryotinia fuckeliana (strain T4) TaxID=999810 RepID=G2YEN8_BOTF4|nr:predicted protein [Botrytis cinerea T4]